MKAKRIVSLGLAGSPFRGSAEPEQERGPGNPPWHSAARAGGCVCEPLGLAPGLHLFCASVSKMCPKRSEEPKRGYCLGKLKKISV